MTHPALFALLFSTLALANPLPLGSTGKTPVLYRGEPSPSVSLVSERLVISDGRIAQLPSFTPHEKAMDVRAVGYDVSYELLNSSTAEVTLEVGFPIVTYGYRAGGSYGGVDKFSASLGGAKLPVTVTDTVHRSIAPREAFGGLARKIVDAGLAQPFPGSPEFLDFSALGADLKAIQKALSKRQLPPGTSRAKIAKKIAEVLGRDDDFSVVDQKLEWHVFALKLPPGKPVKLEIAYESLAGYEEKLGYILRTALFWKGSIGKLEIAFRPDPGFKGRYDFSPRMKRDQATGEYRWEGKAVKPSFDVLITRVSGSE